MLAQLWKTGSIYVLSFGLNSALPFLLLPILSRYLSPADYGIIALWQVLFSFVTVLVGLGVHGALTIYCFDVGRDAPDRTDLLGSYIAGNFLVLGVTTIAVAGVLGLLSPVIQAYLVDIPTGWILATAWVATATGIVNLTLAYLNAEMKARSYAAVTNGQTIANAAISLLLVVAFALGWQGRLAGQAVGAVSVALCCLAYLSRQGLLSAPPRLSLVRHSLLFAVPLLPHILSSVVRAITDRLFLSQITDLAEIGQFSVALSLASIFGVLGNAFQQAWAPWLYRNLQLGQDADRNKIVRLTYAGFIAFAVLGVGFASLAPWIFSWLVGARFAAGTRFMWWLTGAACLQGAYYLVVPYIAYSKRTHYSSIVSTISLALNIGLNLVLSRRFGAMGVAATNFLTALIEFVAVFYASSLCVPMPWLASLRSRATSQSGDGRARRTNLWTP
jgi:O-antigen/teichoic acid export membrane protein